ncbi:DUF1254 domain-containing protein [Roseibium aggregatum]|uniref:DUF1254 domain-containing protein n=1 Tax=Roseibium aggregatum TaxID=187304 RepID=A0A926NVE7_9HYPH|nr:DUF1254 domain-containing protein [Roseibium aggregatum]MBD1545954.1 DUF1254 domain-containing protein [Roseibium aggregatum]
MKRSVWLAIAGLVAFSAGAKAADLPSNDEIKSIAEEAVVYGLPMVMDYGIMYEYAVARGGSQYKAPFNQLYNDAQVFTPEDTSVPTPNSDTPYSMIWMDLRAEPMVLCVPEIEKDRYYSIMLNSQYTFNFGYIGSRATGNGAGCYAVAGPGWSGDTPRGIEKVFVSETEFALAVYRTQLIGPGDIDNVKAIQAKYQAKPLSEFLGTPAPAAAPAVDWPKIDKAAGRANPFGYLAFILQFCPDSGPAAVEKPLRARFASIGIVPGQLFSTEGWSDDQKAALVEGMKAGKAAVEDKVKGIGESVNSWRISKGLFGTRDMLKGDYALRAAAAVAGILGNDSDEALYPMTRWDGSGQLLEGSNSYVLTFPADGLPPVNAFWSVTMYDGKDQLLVENPINRYLINSPMLPDLQKNADGSLSLYIQHAEPTDPKAKANWLPAPEGEIYLVMRLYWPKASGLDGSWKPPAIAKAE